MMTVVRKIHVFHGLVLKTVQRLQQVGETKVFTATNRQVVEMRQVAECARVNVKQWTESDGQGLQVGVVEGGESAVGDPLHAAAIGVQKL